AGLLLEPFLETREECIDAVEVFLDLGPLRSLIRTHLEVLEDAHTREDPPSFRGLRDAHLHDVVRRRVRDVSALEDDAPLAGVVGAVDRTKGRRLSGSVRPDERDDLA